MVDKTIHVLDPATTTYNDTLFAVESSETVTPYETQKVQLSQLCDQSSIITSGGTFSVSQTTLDGLHATVTTTNNNISLHINNGAESTAEDIITSNTLSYDGDTITSTLNTIAANATSNGSTINVNNPSTTTVTKLDTALSDIFTGGGGITPHAFTSSTYTITTEEFLIYSGTTNTTVTLPDASVVNKVIRIVSTSNSFPPKKMTVQGQLGQIINGSSSVVFTTKQFQVMEFLSTTVGWVKIDTARGYQGVSAGDTLQFSTRQLDGGAASYSLMNGGHFLCTIMDNIATISFDLSITVTGSPTSVLITNITLTDLLDGFNYSSVSQVVGFSKVTVPIVYGGGFTSDFYYRFASVSGENNIAATTQAILTPDSYDASVFMQLNLF